MDAQKGRCEGPRATKNATVGLQMLYITLYYESSPRGRSGVQGRVLRNAGPPCVAPQALCRPGAAQAAGGAPNKRPAGKSPLPSIGTSNTMSSGMSAYRWTSCWTDRWTLCWTVRSTVPGGLCWGRHARTARPRKARGAPVAPRGSQAAHAKNTGFGCNVSAQRSGSWPRQREAPLFPRLGGPETTWHVSPTRGRSTAPRQRVCETAVLARFWHRCCRCDQKKKGHFPRRKMKCVFR